MPLHPPPASYADASPDPHVAYLGQDVDQSFITLITETYKQQFAAADEAHAAPPTDDVGIVALCEAASVTGAAETCDLARLHAVTPPQAP